MLHGFTSTPRQFKELSIYLSEKGFNVLAPLIAGHGTSPKDMIKTSPKEWTESAKNAYFKLKGISEKVFIVGNSFGSNLAFWMAKELNNEPSAIIALGAPIFLRYHNLQLLIFFVFSIKDLRLMSLRDNTKILTKGAFLRFKLHCSNSPVSKDKKR